MHLDAARTPRGEVTRLLHAARGGDTQAMDRIVPLVYDDLCVLADRQLRREFSPRMMHRYRRSTRPTPLAMGLLARDAEIARTAIAARAMRQVLVDHARRRSAACARPGGGPCSGMTGRPTSAPTILTNDAIDELDPRQRQVVECRFFGGE
jgi:hypothetical protein